VSEMAVKTGRDHPGPPKTQDRCALEFPFARQECYPSIQGSLQLVNISKRKAEAGSSFMPPYS
jgi:hypothetical protein